MPGRRVLCLLISGLQPQLGAREVASAVGIDLEKISDRLYTLQLDNKQFREFLIKFYDCIFLQEVLLIKAVSNQVKNEKEFYRTLAAKCDWRELKDKSFAVTVRKLGGYPSLSSIELAASIADGIIEALGGRCKVALKAPDVSVRLITSPEAVVLGVQVLRARGDRYRFRSKKFKAFRHPASLTPEDAGVLVNLTGWRSPLLDPFCGSGTIVVEACSRGLEAVGLDIDVNAAKGARCNLTRFSCSARGHIVVGDASLLPFRARAFKSVATNPPYGRVLSSIKSSIGLVHSILREGSYVLTRGAVVALVRPSTHNLSAEGFYIEEHPVRVHGGLTRLFTIIRRWSDD